MCICSVAYAGPATRLLIFVVKSYTVDILYIEETLIEVNKPAGLPVLPDGWEKDAPYLVQMLEQQFGLDASSAKGLWVVHRLDKSTSGVIVFARTSEAHRALNA